MKQDIQYSIGKNIAFKIPKFKFNQTIEFYKALPGITLEPYPDNDNPTSYYARFDHLTLWFDCMQDFTKSDVWLELETNDMQTARENLSNTGVPFRPELEPLPANLDASWISDPAGTVLLLKGRASTSE